MPKVKALLLGEASITINDWASIQLQVFECQGTDNTWGQLDVLVLRAVQLRIELLDAIPVKEPSHGEHKEEEDTDGGTDDHIKRYAAVVA